MKKKNKKKKVQEMAKAVGMKTPKQDKSKGKGKKGCK